MVRFKNIRKNEEGLAINMTPLIDIIFNLLIFFLITAAITVKGIDLDLPEASTAEKMPSKSWEIIIDENEKIIFNDAAIDEFRLKKIFEAEKIKPESERVSSIILKADRKTTFGTFVRVMDTARQSGFYDLVIATEPGKE
ncbi:MAG TPA: biopolymer transporter ExbD [Spirochaetota bacterium]|nr:biopolymer transporter ExbD [Spirochaetota bacterium]HPF05978.1 biopolymer transporter ExbD [Spirochaetota bacterium]HPJ42602.1 biopolymer transporter ExbD [Spirochaetota bacterium]HPR37364.1 biopolymer transporter ExbD [Spirochaetota bacterium]HRX47181.1 biopolymer transporter ExbD [Spirochaetota bacterium]